MTPAYIRGERRGQAGRAEPRRLALPPPRFNIESLTVGHTEQPGVSRMTIVVRPTSAARAAVEANLYKLVHVLRSRTSRRRPPSYRDLALIKVAATPATRGRR